MKNAIWIVLGLLVLAAGACWEAYRLSSATRHRKRRSLRARRAELWRRRREEAEQADGRDPEAGAGPSFGKNDGER